MRHVRPALCLLLAFSSAANADLRYTTHVEVRAKAQANKDPGVAAMMQMLMPSGDTLTFVGADAIRIEQWRDRKKVVILLRADGQTLLDSETRTYTRVPELGDVISGAAAQPSPTFKRTGEFAWIRGVRAERVEVTMPVTLPLIPPPGFPTVLTMTGELWLSNAVQSPLAGVRKALGLSEQFQGLEGMVLRQILRSPEFGYEVESTVTELSDEPIAPAMFSIPEGYRDASRIGLR